MSASASGASLGLLGLLALFALPAVVGCTSANGPSLDHGATTDRAALDRQPLTDSLAERSKDQRHDAPLADSSADSRGVDLTVATSCVADYADCAAGQFVDATVGAAKREIVFSNFEYKPKCLRVRVGQTVTFKGNFFSHPLRYGCGPSTTIVDGVGATPLTIVFDKPGLHGHYCHFHGTRAGQTMAGAIEVVP